MDRTLYGDTQYEDGDTKCPQIYSYYGYLDTQKMEKEVWATLTYSQTGASRGFTQIHTITGTSHTGVYTDPSQEPHIGIYTDTHHHRYTPSQIHTHRYTPSQIHTITGASHTGVYTDTHHDSKYFRCRVQWQCFCLWSYVHTSRNNTASCQLTPSISSSCICLSHIHHLSHVSLSFFSQSIGYTHTHTSEWLL